MAYRLIPEPHGPFQLGDFFLEDRRFPAVYFLIDAGRIVYVGQSRTLRWRIDAHMAEGKKVFDAVSFIPCTIDRLLEIEGHFIRRIAPKYNNCGAANATRKREYWRFPASAKRQMLSPEEAAEFLGLTEDQLQKIPSDVLPCRRIRRPRSNERRTLYHEADLNRVRVQETDMLQGLGLSDAKRVTRHRNRKAA